MLLTLLTSTLLPETLLFHLSSSLHILQAPPIPLPLSLLTYKHQHRHLHYQQRLLASMTFLTIPQSWNTSRCMYMYVYRLLGICCSYMYHKTYRYKTHLTYGNWANCFHHLKIQLNWPTTKLAQVLSLVLT